MPGIGTPRRRLAEPRSEPGRDHRAVAGADRGAEGGLHLVGPGQIRPALQHRRHERAGGHPARLRAAGRRSTTTYTGDGDDLATGTTTSPSRRWAARAPSSTTASASTRRCTTGTEIWSSRSWPALRAYQFSLAAPAPPAGSFDAAAAERGKTVFDAALRELPPGRRAHRRRRHAARTRRRPARTRPTRRAARARSTGRRRCAALWQHPPYFHDGSAATLPAVVNHYDQALTLGMADQREGRPGRIPEVVLVAPSSAISARLRAPPARVARASSFGRD